MNKQQFQNAKYKALLAISQAETQLAKAQFVHLNRLHCTNERLEHVRLHIKNHILERLEDAENGIISAKKALGKAQAKYNELMTSKVPTSAPC